MVSIPALVEDIHSVSKRRLLDDDCYRSPLDAIEEVNLLMAHARPVESHTGYEVKNPFRVSLGLILFLNDQGKTTPLFWGGDARAKGGDHRSLIPEILLQLPHNLMKASVWATEQLQLARGGAVVKVLPTRRGEYETDYGGSTIPIELGLRSLVALSTEFPDTPFLYEAYAFENGKVVNDALDGRGQQAVTS